MVATLMMLALNHPAGPGAVKPGWYDASIGRLSIRPERDATVAFYDHRSRYALICCSEEVGGTLTLTRDREAIRDLNVALRGWKMDSNGVRARPADLRKVRTGKGIRIGDSPDRVRRVLGEPTSINWPPHHRGPFFTFNYYDRGRKLNVEERYRFHNRRLEEVDFEWGPEPVRMPTTART